jgi:hypothetical protein
MSPRKKPSDANQNYSSHGRGGEAADKSERLNPQPPKNPSADDRPDQPQKGVSNEAKASSANHLAAEPSGDKAYDYPGEQSMGHPHAPQTGYSSILSFLFNADGENEGDCITVLLVTVTYGSGV